MSGALSSALLASCTSKPTDSSEASATKADSVDKKVSARPAHGGYEGEDGPQAWATLSPAYAFCGTGQSPVNFVKTDARGGATWRLDYKSTSLRIAHNEHMEDIIDNGHTIQITVDEGSAFTFAGKHYHLKQFHFHTPGEHTLTGSMPRWKYTWYTRPITAHRLW